MGRVCVGREVGVGGRELGVWREVGWCMERAHMGRVCMEGEVPRVFVCVNGDWCSR